jgi:hypothetical protein
VAVAKFVGVRLADPYTDEVGVEGKLSSLGSRKFGICWPYDISIIRRELIKIILGRAKSD